MGYTLDEVAGIAGRSKSYIKKVLYRAINKVRESDEQ